MARKQPSSSQFSTDIEYLISNRYDLKKGSSPTYAHRLAQRLRAIQAIEPGAHPPLAELRGHDRAAVVREETHKGTREQTSIYTPSRRDLDVADVANLIKKSPKPSESTYLLVFTVLVTKYPARSITPGIPERMTLAAHVKISSVNIFIKENKAGTISSLIDFVSDIFDGVEIVAIEMIGVVHER